MTAVRAEMPGVSVAFASIGLCHGVLVLLFEGFWTKLRALVENTMERREKIEKHQRQVPFSFLKPKAQAG